MTESYPNLCAVVLDAVDSRALAEFYRRLLGYEYSDGDGPPAPGEPDVAGERWMVLNDQTGTPRLAVQHVDELIETTWPAPGVPQQLHIDLTVANRDQLAVQRDRAVALGAEIIDDRFADDADPLVVFRDPAGHPFCIIAPPVTSSEN